MGRNRVASWRGSAHVISAPVRSSSGLTNGVAQVAIAPCGAGGGRHDETEFCGEIWLVAYTSVLV
jgi:hypothetical protein